LDGGGSERQLWQLAAQLPIDQFDKQVYLLYRRGLYLDQLPTGIPVHAFSDLNFHSRIPGAIHRAQVSQLANLLRQQHIDVVYDRTYHMTLVTSKACRRAQVPRVSVIVSPPSRDFARNRERFRWFKYRVLRKAYSDPNSTTIAVSQSVAEDAARFYRIPIHRLQVLPNPVDIDAVQRAAIDSQAMRTVLESEAESSLRIVVVGRMTEEKGHHLLLAAIGQWEASPQVASLGHMHADFVGDGPLRPVLQRQSDQLRISHRVRFCGFQTNPYPWIASADILCIPSMYEGLPNVALEAMALKKPVIATPCSDSLSALLGNRNQRGVVLNDSTPGSFVEAFKTHLQNPYAAAQQAKLAYDWISQHHGLQQWITLMSQLFQSVAKRAAGRQG
jgi:glycosyltransferase involved in cell wall biosynthesis